MTKLVFDADDLGELRKLRKPWINTTTLHAFDKERARKIFAFVASRHPGARLNVIEEYLNTNDVPYEYTVLDQLLEIASAYFPPQ